MSLFIAAMYAQMVGLVFTGLMRSMWPLLITSGICGLLVYLEAVKP